MNEHTLPTLEEAAELALKDLEHYEKTSMGGIRLASAEALRVALGKGDYVIRKTKPDGAQLFYNHDDGWTESRSDATRFPKAIKDTTTLRPEEEWVLRWWPEQSI